MINQSAQWDDFYIAYQVAKCGSLSKAGVVLNLNHATVLRHVNRLENKLGSKLFIRHQRGYRLTEAGQLLVAQLPDIMEQFNRLEHLIIDTEKNIVGNLTVTTANDNTTFLASALMQFKEANPNLRINLVASDEILPLATGAAHVSLRAGKEPRDPDLIVRKLLDVRFDYYAAEQYVQRHGELKTIADINQHYWVLPSGDKQNISTIKIILNKVEEKRIVYQSNSFLEVYNAIERGFGIGPIPLHLVNNYKNIKKMPLSVPETNDALWFVYHRHLKENVRIKALYDFIIDFFS